MKRAIVVMVGVWLIGMTVALTRAPVRIRYWTWQLGRSSDAPDRDYYKARLTTWADRATGVVGGLMAHSDPNVRRCAIRVIERSGASEADDLLFAALSDPASSVRDAAALGLGSRAGPGMVERLADLARRGSAGSAAAAVFALQRTAQPAAVDVILDVLENPPSMEACVQAIESLGLLGEPRAEALLAGMVDDRRSVAARPANERSLWQGLSGQRDRPVVGGLAAGALRDGTSKTVGDYAAAALRQIRRDKVTTAAASHPSSRDAARSR